MYVYLGGGGVLCLCFVAWILVSFRVINHFAEEKRASCFTVIVLCLWLFSGHTHLLFIVFASVIKFLYCIWIYVADV